MVYNLTPLAARLAIPIAIAALLLNLSLDQFKLFSRILRESDKVLSIAKGDGAKSETYDYVIIGAGASGSVLAKRLTESGKLTVLLLEMGGDPNPVSDFPSSYIMLTQSDMTAPYATVPQKNACRARDGICMFLRGIAVGGSTAVNGMLYNRCNPKDYDQWANFTKDPIWSAKSVTTAFEDIESYHGWYENVKDSTRGSKGEMHLEGMRFMPGAEPFFKALVEKGYPIKDINNFAGLNQDGFTKIDYNMKQGRRWGTYQAFIQPILERPNLHLYRYARATKIHLDEKKHAVGVTYERHGHTRYVAASKEIILAAGAIDSPKVLLLSGIGCKTHLKEHGIEAVLDLPAVGRNLQDHISILLPHFVLNSTVEDANYDTPAHIMQYLKDGSGPYQWISQTVGFSSLMGMGYISSKSNVDKSWPDLQVYLTEQVLNNTETLHVIVALVKSEQTGNVTLRSSKPDDHPVIDPGFFTIANDIERVVDGIMEITEFFLHSPVYKSLGLHWSDESKRPAECAKHEFGTRDYWRCYVPIKSLCSLHTAASCRMGPDASNSVVDSRLRVFGTTGLRVIDSSAMPFAPNGNTNFPSIMFGEMGAKILLDQI